MKARNMLATTNKARHGICLLDKAATREIPEQSTNERIYFLRRRSYCEK
jgi:hypothetical protein